jgi:broad specificity phosphatase PhoE
MVAGQFGTQIELTPTGIERANDLGRTWGSRIQKVSSSSSYRCVKTGEQIILGAGLNATTLHNPPLGEPGAFINHSEKAIETMKDYGPMELVNALLQGDSLSGHVDVSEGTRIILQSFFSENPSKGTIRIEVTHDTILAALIYHLLGLTSITEKDWPRMLEGALLWQEDEKICWKWRGDEGSRKIII